jgi:hypothetical protein
MRYGHFQYFLGFRAATFSVLTGVLIMTSPGNQADAYGHHFWFLMVIKLLTVKPRLLRIGIAPMHRHRSVMTFVKLILFRQLYKEIGKGLNQTRVSSYSAPRLATVYLPARYLGTSGFLCESDERWGVS